MPSFFHHNHHEKGAPLEYQQNQNQTQYAPPSEPYPGTEPETLHPWQDIPDTSLYPPPPAFAHTASSTSNASEEAAIAAHRWCEQHPLIKPAIPNAATLERVRRGQFEFKAHDGYHGKIRKARGEVLTTKTSQTDCVLMSSLPVYFAAVESPFRNSEKERGKSSQSKTIYFEVKVSRIGQASTGEPASLAIGFVAAPYPTWRMPGWERGSLAVHSDDGNRFVGDSEGGREFTSPFRVGDTVGIGMTFKNEDGRKCDVFFTRNGKVDGTWDLFEEVDADEIQRGNQTIQGLEGGLDLYASVGMFGEVECEATFEREKWLFKP